MTFAGETSPTHERPDDYVQVNFDARASIKALAKLYGKEHGLTLRKVTERALKKQIFESADEIREQLDVEQAQFMDDSSSILTLLDELEGVA